MVRRFKPKGNGDIVEISAANKFQLECWRKESDYFEVDVNGNKLPDLEGLIDFWNSHASQAKAKKPKE